MEEEHKNQDLPSEEGRSKHYQAKSTESLRHRDRKMCRAEKSDSEASS